MVTVTTMVITIALSSQDRQQTILKSSNIYRLDLWHSQLYWPSVDKISFLEQEKNALSLPTDFVEIRSIDVH